MKQVDVALEPDAASCTCRGTTGVASSEQGRSGRRPGRLGARRPLAGSYTGMPCLQLRTEVHRQSGEDPQIRTYVLIL